MKERLTKRLNRIKAPAMSLIYRKIAGMDEFKGRFNAEKGFSRTVLGRLKRTAVITSAGASTRIEGSKLSDNQVKEVLRDIKISKLIDRDSQEVAGYADVINTVFDSYEHIKVSENQVLGLHKMLLNYSKKDAHHKGKYKNSSNSVVARDGNGKESIIFNPTEPFLTPIEMKELFEWLKEAEEKDLFHPLLLIANFVLEFLSIHPFQDGNGRLSRALTTLLILKYGYSYAQYSSVEKIIEDNKSAYYISLRESQKNRKKNNEDITPWLVFFFDILSKQVEVIKKLVSNSTNEDLLSENQTRVLGLFDAHAKVTNKIVVDITGIGRETATQVLNRLLELNFIRRTGSGRSTAYEKVK